MGTASALTDQVSRLAGQVDLFDDTGGEKGIPYIPMQLIIAQLAGRPDGAARNL